MTDPRYEDDLYAQAVRLRSQGCSVPAIAQRLGVAKSTAYRWSGHIPLPDERNPEPDAGLTQR